jgi:glycosyltransferase involved in cell wall biosynthesis
LDIAKQFAARFPERIRVISNERNLGCCLNFEKAIGLTTGDVIFLSDADDVWFPEKVEAMLGGFEEDASVVLVYSDAVIADRELRPTGKVFDRRQGVDLRKAPDLHVLGHGIGFNGPMIAFHAKLKPFVLPISPLSMQWTHDHWIPFISYAVGEIKVVDRPLVYYRRHGKNEGGDAEFDGGLRHQLQVVTNLHNNSKRYGERRRGWEDMVARLREIKSRGLIMRDPAKLAELLQLSELCLQFATARQMQEAKSRLARTPSAVRLLLGGDYHRYARGIKSFVQDLLIS